MIVIPNLLALSVVERSKHFSRLIAIVLTLCLCASPAFAHAKHKLRLDTSLVPLDTALQSNDLVTAQSLATSIYQQTVKAFTSTDPTIIIDPAVVTTQGIALAQCKTAYAIADSFYRHADLTDAKQWATTATAADRLSNPYARRAKVLLGNIAYAMDEDDVAAAHFQGVIALPNLYPEQASAYAGLLDVLLQQKQDDQVAQWVKTGQAKFANGGDLQLAFLQDTERVLKHRNHSLWRDLDQQIVDLFPNAPSRLQALRELASNARKFERWAEAESNYTALCATQLPNAHETADTWVLLAECQAKQSKDVSATLSNLVAACAGFSDLESHDYGMYRLGKFYEEHGNLDAAYTNYQLLVTSPSASTWTGAAFHQLGALKEKQGDLQGALQIYLQYPQRYPQNQAFAIQSYASALNVAEALGDSNSANLVYAAITNNAAAIQDYNVVLNLCRYFMLQGNPHLARSFLESGLSLARQMLASTTDPAQRALIEYRVLRRLCDFDQHQRTLDYLAANAADFPGPNADPNSDNNHLQCYFYKALALYGTTNQESAITLMAELLDRAQGNAELEGSFGEDLALLYQRYSDLGPASQLFGWVIQKYPSHPWASLGRLVFAIQSFNKGDFTTARKLADDITNGLPEKSWMDWIRITYWSGVYIRGCCLAAQGNASDGSSLKTLALSKSPDLPVQRYLKVQ
jgi:hypothetical protein